MTTEYTFIRYYRPILINGVLEASYPSSTTLLVRSVMPTLKFQIDPGTDKSLVRNVTGIFAIAFSVFQVIGRLLSGVHWATDIIGQVFLSEGLFLLYRYAVSLILAYTTKVFPQTAAKEFKGLAHAELVLMFPECFREAVIQFLEADGPDPVYMADKISLTKKER